MTWGQREAQKDFKDYQDGKITKKDLANMATMAKWYANFGGSEEAADYLWELNKLGFIKVWIDD